MSITYKHLDVYILVGLTEPEQLVAQKSQFNPLTHQQVPKWSYQVEVSGPGSWSMEDFIQVRPCCLIICPPTFWRHCFYFLIRLIPSVAVGGETSSSLRPDSLLTDTSNNVLMMETVVVVFLNCESFVSYLKVGWFFFLGE